MKGRFHSLFSMGFSRKLPKDIESYTFAIALSIILHMVVVILLTINWRLESTPKFIPPKPISA
ncbi:MAG: hypothetical protein ACPGEF_07890, partial [Endozoicomonas sp.]